MKYFIFLCYNLVRELSLKFNNKLLSHSISQVKNQYLLLEQTKMPQITSLLILI